MKHIVRVTLEFDMLVDEEFVLDKNGKCTDEDFCSHKDGGMECVVDYAIITTIDRLHATYFEGEKLTLDGYHEELRYVNCTGEVK